MTAADKSLPLNFSRRVVSPLLSQLKSRLASPLGFLATGVLFVFCFPKWNAGGWLAWGAFVPFLLAARQGTYRSAARWGGFAGLVAHLGTMAWVYPTCRWGGVGIFFSAVALLALCSYLAAFWVLFAVAVRALDGHRAAKPFLVAAVWVALEFLRTHLFSGFPWLLLAVSQWKVPKHLPLAEFGGAYAVSFLVMLFNAGVALVVEGAGRRAGRSSWRAALPAAAALIGLTVASVLLWRRPFVPSGPAVNVAIVQGNIDQYKKWNETYEKEIVSAYTALTQRAAERRPRIIVWPETAVPGWIPNDEKYLKWIAGLGRETGAWIVFGAVSRQEGGDYNAAFLMSPAGELLGLYRKQHLVPFGEFVPLKSLFGRLVGVLNALGDFDAGPAPSLLKATEPLGVNVCFEGIFPGMVREFTREGARLLVNITNDGWYRDTAAPEQHFASNVLRAVENKRWVIRAANTGISGFISPKGETAERSALLEPAVVFGAPEPVGVLPFYVRRGDVLAWACVALSLLSLGMLVSPLARPPPLSARHKE